MIKMKISCPGRLAGKLLQIREHFTYPERQIIEASMLEHQFKCFVLTNVSESDCARFSVVFRNAGMTVDLI